MRRIVFATGNQGKLKEIKEIMKDIDVEVVSMKEADALLDVDETGTTFSENAEIKAKSIAEFLKNRCEEQGKTFTDIVLADDSGLEVDALNKEPGIYSARYMGEDTPYSEKNANIIERLEGVEVKDRSARFVCAIAACVPNEDTIFTRATIEGYIGYEEKGANGFGYDPIFMVPEFNCTTAELTMEQKNQISHRGKALMEMKSLLMQKGFIHENLDC